FAAANQAEECRGIEWLLVCIGWSWIGLPHPRDAVQRLDVHAPDIVATDFDDSTVWNKVHQADGHGNALRIPRFGNEGVDRITILIERLPAGTALRPLQHRHLAGLAINLSQSATPLPGIDAGEHGVVADMD